MFVYLISEGYEGFSSRVFSSQELAEQFLIDREDLFSDVVRVSVDTNDEEFLPESPALLAIRGEWRAQALREMQEFLAEQVCDVCGVQGHKACRCYAEVPCGSFGGVTKKGSACLNSVLEREGSRCYLHA